MSNEAFSSGGAKLPAGVGGYAAAEFEPLVRAFARLVGNRRGAGGALSVHRHGEPLVEIWTGQAAPGVPWTRDTGSIVFSATKGIAATVIHRLADRGLIEYDAPVAHYWPEFGAAGKDRITVRQLLTHRAGLSGLGPIAAGLDDVLDHRLMEQRLAAAKPDRLLGVPTYHALTFGWLLSGLARAVTGRGMGELIRSEVAEPLGIDGMYLGRPPVGAPTTVAALSGSRLAVAGSALGALFLGRASGIPGAAGAATRALFLPGLEAMLEGDEPPILATELAAGNGVCTAHALATLYGALATGSTPDGRRYLSARTTRALRKVESYHLDHALFYLPMLWHLGYHSLPVPGAHNGFGHIGLGGSFGWSDPHTALSVGYVHNRLTLNKFAWDQLAASWVLPLAVRNAHALRRSTPALDRAA
ncbi:beta-lactamase family protein [Nocardia sp. CDC159]|uniref:Beta-lactamase family protein n=1 Tax=Nocardia pulmonis TaxID=2951408 RepID=A0A9X2E455_9NOCA|nr:MULTISPECIES: serine hydrolase domain-containing protein [Nocardia]MCM6773286.1 beta-lactamase family protein [Nocardia pulmonis]MCM6786173.1 beta-lactamase family protein [Nocardia sp. CDC159]